MRQMRSEERKEISPSIIFENKDFLALNKPAGWIVNDADTAKDQPTVQNWLAQNYDYEIAKNRELRSGVVHRLDKETSGILLIAKNEKSFFELQSLFKQRLIKKEYTALLHGLLKQKEGIIVASVGRLPWNRRRFGVLPGGRDAKTGYRLKEIYFKDNEKYSLVNFYPETGRTHQIRIHAKYLGNPLVGDSFYSGRKRARKSRSWCPRLFLHASRIEVPWDKKTVIINSELSNDLQNVLNLLEKDINSK